MKTLKSYAEAMSAHIDQSLLKASGIASEVLNENMNYAGFFAGSDFAIQLVVADEDYERARQVLSEPAGSLDHEYVGQ